MYHQKILDHFSNPRNTGEIKDADGVGTVGDPSCGDYLRIYIKVKYNRLSEVRFKIYGCPAAIATASVLTELAWGKTIEEARKITDEDIVRALGGLPEPKVHCSNLGTAALNRAIMDFYNRKGTTRQPYKKDKQKEQG